MTHVPDLIYWRTMNGKKLRLEQLGAGRHSRLMGSHRMDQKGAGLILAKRHEALWYRLVLVPERMVQRWWRGARPLQRLVVAALMLAMGGAGMAALVGLFRALNN